MKPASVLVLGIDAASPDLLETWVAAGKLPNLASLVERGRATRTEGIDGFFIGSTWPSIYTGLAPARHGFHYLAQLRSGSYDFYRPSERGLFEGTPVWSALSRAGRRVAILDAPLSALDASLNGLQVLEWGGHDCVYGFQTHPAGLAERIRSRFGAHPLGRACDGVGRSAEAYGAFLDALVRGIEIKSEMTRHFLCQAPPHGDWDFFMQVFSEAHCAGHQCWHLHDAGHPAHDASVASQLGDPLERVYRAIDAAIGDILASVGEREVFVFSSHGMSHWYGAHFLLSEILFRLGVAEPAAAPPPSRSLRLARSVWHRLPDPMRRGLRDIRERYEPWADPGPGLPTLGANPRGSRCFQHPNGLAVCGIRLNLAGREPEGILEPGAPADDFCQALADDLLSIIDERTGRPLIRRVLRVADTQAGPRLADLPDLLLDFDDAIATGSTEVGAGAGATVRVRSPKIGVVEGTNRYGRTGEHRQDGWLVASGPSLSEIALPERVSVLDLAPTWTRMLGVDLGPVDGTAMVATR